MFCLFRCNSLKFRQVLVRLVVRPNPTDPTKTVARWQHSTSTDGQTVASLCVIGNGCESNPCSLALVCDQTSYLFNCGEGLQRLIPQYKLKISRIPNFFITSNHWHNISGISGLMLTQIDSGLNKFNVFGLDLEQLIQLITNFDFKFDNCLINTTDYRLEENKPFIDKNVIISPIVIIPEVKTERTTVAYICQLLPKRGVLQLDKCFHMKIPRNLLPQLMAGQTIVLDNGQSVSPAEVHTPDITEQSFVVFECRSEEMLKSLLKSEDFSQQLTQNINTIECVVHMTPNHVLDIPDYHKLLQRFPKHVKHLVLNEQNPSFGLHSVHRMQTQLNCLDSKVFPMINEKIEIDKTVETFTKFDTKLVKCQTGVQYVFRPQLNSAFSFDALEEFVNLKHIRDDALKEHNGNDRPGLRESIEQLRKEQKLIEHKSKTEPYPEVVFLGTASAQPLSIRNVTSILVNISTDSAILLDCGEDTFGQLYRFYGCEQLSSVLDKLKAVFVTHMHTDHHMGLIRVIDKHFERTSKPIHILIPPVLSNWLNRYSEQFEDIRHKYIVWLTTDLSTTTELTTDWSQVLSQLELKQLKAIPVKHCSDSFAVLLQTQANGRRIVFSGDAEPNNEELVNIGKDCDLLIHEATQDDGRVRLARLQCHSTIGEAIDVGRRMSAKFTILTHFSQRYGKLPLISDQHKSDPKLGLAFDMMRVSISELSRLPILSPALHSLYATHIEKMKDRESTNRRKELVYRNG